MDQMTFLGIGHVGMFVQNLEKSKRFYMEILRFHVVSEYEEKERKCVF